jgi:hypothetical protein
MVNDPVIIALQQQVVCYQKLAKLADLQHQYVQKGQTDDLLGVLQRRQEVLDQIAAFEQTVAPAKRGWNDYLAGLAMEDRLSAESLLAETRRLLEQITVADRNDTIVLQQRKLNLSQQINKRTVARNINKNYAAAAYGPRRSNVDIQQ